MRDKFLYNILLRSLFSVLLVLLSVTIVSAQDEEHGDAPEDEFTYHAYSSQKEGLYKAGEKIGYNIKIYNSYDVVQEGTLSYLVTNFNDGKEVAKNSVPVKLGKKSNGNYNLSLPPIKNPGFYKVMFMLNVTEYDDTLRKVFGVDVKGIKSPTPKPADFDDFWADARAELAGIKPNFKMIEQPDMEQNGTSVYLIEAQSLGNLKIRGWLTIAKKRKPGQKFPVW
ncbi:MAG: hypothetical protein EOP46_20055, partial [Sphingobacteriaceae bacterium]